jgi:hypothetical protein
MGSPSSRIACLGDGIKVAGAASATLDSTGRILSISGSSGVSLGTITLASSYTGDAFSVLNGTVTVSLPSPPTLTVSNVISGPANTDNAAVNGYWVIPPDNALAVSATDVLMAENDVIEVTDLSGTILLNPESLSTFFSAVDSGFTLTDPRAIVDPITGKFIVTTDGLRINAAGAVTGSAVLYATSNTTDPTGAWTFGQVNTTYSINNKSTWADQPTMSSESGCRVPPEVAHRNRTGPGALSYEAKHKAGHEGAYFRLPARLIPGGLAGRFFDPRGQVRDAGASSARVGRRS